MISGLALAKCTYISGSLWEHLRVVKPECQGTQIPELSGPMQWPWVVPGSAGNKSESANDKSESTNDNPGRIWVRWVWAWERRRQAWEHLESQ